MMKSRILMLVVCLSLIYGFSTRSDAQFVSRDEAFAAAKTWISVVIGKFGSWGGNQFASVRSVEDLTRNGRTVGYFVRVSPVGYIVVALRKEFPPLQAYSVANDLDPASNQGMSDILKYGAERMVNELEKKAGMVKTAASQSVRLLFERDHRSTWATLLTGSMLGDVSVRTRQKVGDYVEGQILLSSHWNQEWPYNAKCPLLGCGNNLHSRAVVGCVATAAAQIMRYYCWPMKGSGDPYNEHYYDWANMPDTLKETESVSKINAVAQLCADIGDAAGMDYGCDGSSAHPGNYFGKDMLDAYENNFRYDDNADLEYRYLHTADGWFEIIKENINCNRPLQYSIDSTDWGGHSIVCDGWQETGGIRLYHMNYGWTDDHDTWYVLDDLYGNPGKTNDKMIRMIKPKGALGESISGTYPKGDYPYRYIERNATSTGADFDAGQSIQFLQGMSLRNVSSGNGTIKFAGWTTTGPTHIFTAGEKNGGVLIYSGRLQIFSGGSIRFPK